MESNESNKNNEDDDNDMPELEPDHVWDEYHKKINDKTIPPEELKAWLKEFNEKMYSPHCHEEANLSKEERDKYKTIFDECYKHVAYLNEAKDKEVEERKHFEESRKKAVAFNDKIQKMTKWNIK